MLLESLPYTRYHASARLFTWHPRGELDDTLADEVLAVIESEELFEDAPFHRYTDFSGLTRIRLQVGHVFRIAAHRRIVPEPVKSAFFADTTVGLGMARMYESFMVGGIIQVRAFGDRAAAAAWLGVPLELLQPD